MAKYYLDFVGLNTFVYDFAGWDRGLTESKQAVDIQLNSEKNWELLLNHFGYPNPQFDAASGFSGQQPTETKKSQIHNLYKALFKLGNE